MLLRKTLHDIAETQKKELSGKEKGIPREKDVLLDMNSHHALVISGIRRCGKSTLLRQVMDRQENACYFNFEDPRAAGFEVSDFEKLEEALKEVYGQSSRYFFDEIQNVEGWERFVRKLQDQNNKILITGSNASLLSRELGTKLTGRHLTYDLFPFSYTEMLRLTSKKNSPHSFEEYLQKGGFPEYLMYNDEAILQQLFNDIISRDIIVRHGIRNEKTVRDVALYLLSNTGKVFSYNQLKKIFGMGSVNTAISYVSYLQDSYLLFTIPVFSRSQKKQAVNPKKVYAVDTGIARANSLSFSKDKGRMLENIVFLHLRRQHREIYYFKGDNECDFLVREKGSIILAVQVCYELNEENKEREIKGLKEAVKSTGAGRGIIITMDQKDRIGSIEVMPAREWMRQHRV